MPDSFLLTQKEHSTKVATVYMYLHQWKQSLRYDKTNIIVSPALIQRKDMSWKIITSFLLSQSIVPQL